MPLPPFLVQANLLAMLHGAAGLLAQRTPLVAAHMFVLSYPWLPDLVKLVQLGGHIHLPKTFFDLGIGFSYDEVELGAAWLKKLLE